MPRKVVKVIVVVSDSDSESDYETYQNRSCYRCGRNTHWIENCYATWHLKGYRLFD